MKIDKIKALLASSHFNMTDFANHLNKSKQQLSNKAKSDVWSSDELIKLAELTNTKLAFVDEQGKPVITFDSDDLV